MEVKEMIKFKTGETYETRSVCDHNCIFRFKILRRTAKSVWVNVHGEKARRLIEVYDGKETFYPFGKYSMAAIISAR
jgi:hypothetical protein